MPNLPAFCDSCGTVFPSGFVIDQAFLVTLSGNKAGPCPKCKGMGSIPDGVFNFVGGVIEILSAPQITVDRLRRLASLIEELRKNPTEEAFQKLQNEAPELKETIKSTPKDSGHITAWLTLILMAIQTIIFGAGLFAGSSPSKTEIQNMIDKSIESSFKGSVSEPSAQTSSAPPIIKPSKKKVGRNDRCPCGSGKKYKKCCLHK